MTLGQLAEGRYVPGTSRFPPEKHGEDSVWTDVLRVTEAGACEWLARVVQDFEKRAPSEKTSAKQKAPPPCLLC